MKYMFSFCLSTLLVSCVGKREKMPIEIGRKAEQADSIKKIALKNQTMLRNASGELIETEGLFRNNFEDVAIYPSNRSSYTDAIWLKFASNDYPPDSVLNELNEKRIIVIGRLNFSDKGHQSAYFASLDSVFYLKEVIR